MRDLLKAIRPYGNPMEQDMIDMAETLMEGQTPMDQLRRFLTPEQQSRFETMEMIFTAMQAMADTASHGITSQKGLHNYG